MRLQSAYSQVSNSHVDFLVGGTLSVSCSHNHTHIYCLIPILPSTDKSEQQNAWKLQHYLDAALRGYSPIGVLERDYGWMNLFTCGIALETLHSPFCVPWYRILWKKAIHFENTSMYRFSLNLLCALLRRLTNELAHQLTYLPICFTITTTMMLLHMLCSWLSPIKW